MVFSSLLASALNCSGTEFQGYTYLCVRFNTFLVWKKSNQCFPYQEQENNWCDCMVGFDLGLALQQTCILHIPRRGPSSHGASSASGAVFFFSFLLTGFITLLIKAEIQDLKDVQISLPSCLTKPWPSWYFKKHMEGLRFHVAHKMSWFHKYKKVKRDLFAVFTFLQCLQKEGK